MSFPSFFPRRPIWDFHNFCRQGQGTVVKGEEGGVMRVGRFGSEIGVDERDVISIFFSAQAHLRFSQLGRQELGTVVGGKVGSAMRVGQFGSGWGWWGMTQMSFPSFFPRRPIWDSHNFCRQGQGTLVGGE